MEEYLANLFESIEGWFTYFFPFIFENIPYYAYMLMFPILFSTVASIIVMLILKIRGD